VAAGLPPDLFWSVTPREMHLMRAGANDRALRDLRTDQRIAYSTAVLVAIAVNNAKKLPSFDKAFPDGTPKPPMTGQQMMQSMKAWTAAIKPKH
jgi:hypothetical protein